MPFYGGLDWGGIAHAVCVVDGAGQVVARIEARHDDAGLVDMLARLRKIALPTELPIAIERPSGRASTRDTVLPVKRWMLILASCILAERVGVLATVKDKVHCRARACGPP